MDPRLQVGPLAAENSDTDSPNPAFFHFRVLSLSHTHIGKEALSPELSLFKNHTLAWLRWLSG